jgi:AraC-like DNA-binding protein
LITARPMKIGHFQKNYSLIASITRKLKGIGKHNISGIRDNISARRILSKVEERLGQWVAQGRHYENYKSMDDILDELGLTGEELSLYCSKVLKKKFLSWRKELRLEDAKKLLLEHPEAPVCHIGYAVGMNDKSNFRRQFKDYVGYTPLEWRKQNLEKQGKSAD